MGVWRPALATAAVLLLLGGCTGSDPPRVAATSSPPAADSDVRPLDLPVLRAGDYCPVTTVDQEPDPMFGPVLGDGLAGPVGLAGGVLEFSAPSVDSVFTDRQWGARKVLWAVDPSVSEDVLVRGKQLDGPLEIRFGDPAVAELTLRAGEDATSGGWRDYPSYTRIQAPGCYAYQVDTTTTSTIIVFTAEGPALT